MGEHKQAGLTKLYEAEWRRMDEELPLLETRAARLRSIVRFLFAIAPEGKLAAILNSQSLAAAMRQIVEATEAGAQGLQGDIRNLKFPPRRADAEAGRSLARRGIGRALRFSATAARATAGSVARHSGCGYASSLTTFPGKNRLSGSVA